MILTVRSQNKHGANSLRSKTWIIMKLTVALLLFFTFQVSANGNAQQITIVKKNASLSEVFKVIERQTHFLFFYDKDLVQKAEPIDVNLKNATIEHALLVCLKNQPFTYSIVKNTVVIQAKNTVLTEVVAVEDIPALPPPVEIRGRVVNKEGSPLQGVSVLVAGTQNGTTTNSDGRFTLSVPDGENVVLKISSIGYQTKEVSAGKQTVINVTLELDVAGLNDVVVVGYGTQKKVSLTGAISTVGSKELTAITTSDFSNTLTGRLPGLRVMQIGGEPGEYNNKIDIRGWGSMLVIVDGVPRDNFQRIDPSAISSVTILKDASAAVYGLKAANGVMLITTKKGRSGKAEITLSTSYGWQQLTEFPKPIRNAMDNLILKNEAALVVGNPLPYPDWKKYTGEDPNFPNIDWWGLTVKKSMPITKNSLSVSGGNGKITYYLTVDNLYQSGIYKSNSLNYNRSSFRSNISAKVTNNFTADLIISGLTDQKNSPYGNAAYDFIEQVWMQPGYEPIYANNTSPFYYDGEADSNPLAVINSDLTGSRTNQIKYFQTTANLTYDFPFIKGLQIKGLFAYDMTYGHNKIWRKAYNEYKYDNANDVYIPTVLTSPTNLQQTFDETIYTQMQLSLHYKNSFSGGKHNLEALVLTESRNGTGTRFLAQRDYSLSALNQLDAGLTENQVASGSDKMLASNQALVGKFNYDFLSKYIAEFSFRYDGSSLFPKESRWGFFPGFSVGWRVNEESFMKKLPFIDNLKLRFSYGKLGDNSGTEPFAYLQGYIYPSESYILDGKTLTTGASVKGLPNPNITWYTATTTNLGIDADLWNGLLNFTLELFQRNRDGLLANRAIALPPIFGATLPQENLESDISRGFEIVLGHSNRINDFLFNISANLTYARARWRHREAAIPGNSYLNWRNNNDNRWKDLQWGYGVVDQFQNQKEIDLAPVQNANGHSALFPGDIRYDDWNQDGMISDLDMHPIARSIYPEIFFGLNISGSWKGISLSMFFQGAKNYSMMPREQLLGPLPWGRNSSQIFLDRWHHEDPLDFSTPWVPGKYPISRDGFGYKPNTMPSTYWYEDVAYLRLKSIELAYNLPKAWMKKINFQQTRLFVNGFNIYTWKGKNIISDPEHILRGEGAPWGYIYPLMANYNIGLNITF